MKICFRQIVTVLLTLVFTNLAQATPKQTTIVTPGFYLGVQMGISFAGYTVNLSPGFTASSASTLGRASRVYGGFDITRHIGAEIGVTYIHKPNFHSINGGNSAKIKNNMVYLVAKALIPFNTRLAAYVDLGFGYIARSGILINNAWALSDKEIIRPYYGIGFSYLIWPRWSADLTWLQAAPKSRDNLPATNFIGIGIRYKFAG